jgi:hypothetical protein
LTDPQPAKPRRLRLILAFVGVVLVLLGSLFYLNRKSLAREALTGWLRSKGVASDAQVEAIGPNTFTARLRIGDPTHPDFAAERAVVRYRPKLTGLEVVSVTLSKPVLRAALRHGRLSVGALDPLVAEFMRRPPRPDQRQPRIEIDDGLLLVTTDYGPVRVAADALVDNGKLARLAATSAPARLRGQGFDVAVGQGSLRITSVGGRIDARVEAPLPRASAGGLTTENARLILALQAAYPDVAKRRGDGAVNLQARITTRTLQAGGQSFENAELSATIDGQARGWIDDLTLAGRGVASLRAGTARFGAAQTRAMRVAAVARNLTWTRSGGDQLAADLELNGGVEDLTAGDFKLASLTATAAGPVRLGGSRPQATLSGSALGRGGWSGLGAPGPGDSAEMAAIKRAARGFRIVAPKYRVRLKGPYLALALPEPLRILSERGGVAQLASRAGEAVYTSTGAQFRLTVAGGGLPALEADVASLALTEGAAVATGRVHARASIGPIEGGEVAAAGRLRIADGGASFSSDGCAAAKAERLEFGANDVERLSGRLCPSGGPLFTSSGGVWRLAGRAEGVTASVPFLQARIAGGAGPVFLGSERGGLGARIRVEAARLEDTAPQARFNPLAMTGTASLADYIWKADLTFRGPGGVPVGTALLTHDGRLGFGAVVMDTGVLTFAEGGLAPVQLSALAGAIGSPVIGDARFTGRFDWSPEGATSRRTLSLTDLDFQSPAGAVKGLSGELAFTSLAPLKAAPGQTLQIEEVQAIVPLTRLSASFALADNLLKVAGGEARVGGGRVLIDSLEIPLTPGAAIRGVLTFEGVQLHDLVEASPFGDKVELDAKVSGRVPFEADGSRVRITGGELKADQPGRISIDRAALTGVQADGAAPAPVATANDTFTDFAYQAMENLAFDQLDAAISSHEDGRLGVLFHIKGRHDPPTKQQIRIGLMDLIQRRFLGRKLPLPSGTGVNLTLDTTLNLDDLLGDWAEYQKLHGSGGVQP